MFPAESWKIRRYKKQTRYRRSNRLNRPQAIDRRDFVDFGLGGEGVIVDTRARAPDKRGCCRMFVGFVGGM